MNDFGLPDYLELVEEKLKEYTQAASPALKAAVSRFMSAGGKRPAPRLVIAIAAGAGKPVDDKVICSAAAIELVHIGSLVHDDIMDKGELRWGQPTINSKEGINTAILAGDYLLAKAGMLASSVGAEAAVIVAEAIANLCEGQSLELADQFNTGRTVESFTRAIEGKTAALFAAACKLGGLTAGLEGEQLEALSDFGQNFGISYQLMDDVADFTSSAEASGKSVGGDVREGNYTLPVLLSLQGSRKDKLIKLLQSKDVPSGQVLEILQADGSIDKTLAEAEAYKQKAYDSLARIGSDKLAKDLRRYT